MVAINLPKRAAACLIKPARKRDRQISQGFARSRPRRATRPLGYAWTLLISSHLSSFVHVVTVTYRPLKSTRPTTKLRGESCPPWPISTGQWRSYVACRLNRRFFVAIWHVLSPSYLWRNGGAAPGPDLTLAEQCARYTPIRRANRQLPALNRATGQYVQTTTVRSSTED
jgi:hypothetical protein